VIAGARPRPFTVGDADGVLELAVRSYTRDSRWHVGDLAWHLAISGGRGLGDHTDVWTTTDPQDGPPVAVSWWDRIEVDQETRAALTFVGPTTLLPHIVDHTLTRLEPDVAAVDVVVLAVEQDVADTLRRLGFRLVDDMEYFLNLQLDLNGPSPDEAAPTPPAGITVVRGDELQPQAWVELHRAVWPDSSLTVAGRVAMTQRWPYDPAFDLVALAADGTPVSYVLGWLPPGATTGQFEPVGTLPAWRRRGLSRMVGRHVLRAFREAGASRALVYARGDDAYPTPRAVYSRLGFTTHARQHRWQCRR
jgi:GNAT superfamily N-acetyltransferase